MRVHEIARRTASTNHAAARRGCPGRWRTGGRRSDAGAVLLAGVRCAAPPRRGRVAGSVAVRQATIVGALPHSARSRPDGTAARLGNARSGPWRTVMDEDKPNTGARMPKIARFALPVVGITRTGA